jgi:hypothetical protein
MLAHEKVVQQPIVDPSVYAVALALPTDEPKAEAFHQPARRIVLHHPAVDRMQAEVPERQSQKLGPG